MQAIVSGRARDCNWSAAKGLRKFYRHDQASPGKSNYGRGSRFVRLLVFLSSTGVLQRPAGLGPGGLFSHGKVRTCCNPRVFWRQGGVKSSFYFGGEVSRLFRFGQPSFTQLGPLESRLLESVWTRGSVTVRELIADGDLKIAYTTVMTTLDRLYKKQLLNRTAEGRAFRYTPRISREELQRAVAGHAIQQLLASGSATSFPLSYLVEAVTAHDIELLYELQKLVENKRRELQDREKP